MGIEDRISQLEQIVTDYRMRIETLEAKGADRWVSPKELAEIMQCSQSRIYQKIKSGDIYAAQNLGHRNMKIPMSQFFEAGSDTPKKSNVYIKPILKEREQTMEEMVFGRKGG